MKYLKTIGLHLMTACVYFTVTQLLITAIFQITAQQGSKAQFLPFDIEIIVLGFSVVMALIQDVFKIKKLSFAVKLLIHFLLSMASFFGLFALVTGQITNFKAVLILMSGTATVYAVFAGIASLIYVLRKKKAEKNKEYTPVFRDKKN